MPRHFVRISFTFTHFIRCCCRLRCDNQFSSVCAHVQSLLTYIVHWITTICIHKKHIQLVHCTVECDQSRHSGHFDTLIWRFVQNESNLIKDDDLGPVIIELVRWRKNFRAISQTSQFNWTIFEGEMAAEITSGHWHLYKLVNRNRPQSICGNIFVLGCCWPPATFV